MAAAEVTIGGLGRFGVHYDESADDGQETNLTSRFRLNFSAATQTDAGIEVGGLLRIQHDHSNPASAAKAGAARLHAAMGPVTVQVGNVGDAVDAMPGLYLPTTSVGTGVNFMDSGSVAIHSVGGFGAKAGVVNGVAFKLGMSGLNLQVNASDDHSDRVLSGHLAYKIGDWQVALAGLDDSSPMEKNIVVGTVTGDLGFASVGAAFGRNENVDPNMDADKVRIFGHIPVGMATELVIWGADEDKNPDGDGGSFGIDVEHHLGGGVTAVAGFSDSAIDDGAQASAGVFFKF
ncbi:MAG: porin [Aestuariivita sp.]|nr:porin [Aestuariivita sp.]